METWIKLIGTKKDCYISNYGRLKSIFHYSGKRNDRNKGVRETILKQQKDDDGYFFVSLPDLNGNRKNFRIHKEVARHFIYPDFDSLNNICHKDDNRGNNYVSNLYVGNHITNTLDKYRHKTTKLTISQIREIRTIGRSIPQKEIAKKYKIRDSYVSRILSMKRCQYI